MRPQFAHLRGLYGGPRRDKDACLEDERTAESTLAQNWSKYNADDKTQCVGTVKTGGPASYVELLFCLEIMRDAKEFRDGDSLSGRTSRRSRHVVDADDWFWRRNTTRIPAPQIG